LKKLAIGNATVSYVMGGDDIRVENLSFRAGSTISAEGRGSWNTRTSAATLALNVSGVPLGAYLPPRRRRATGEALPQSSQLKDAAQRDVFLECRERIRAMSLIHDRLYSTGKYADIDFGDYVPDEQSDPANLLHHAESSLHAAQAKGGDRCVGGSAITGAAATTSPSGTFSAFLKLFQKKKPNEDFRRGTD